MIAVLVGASPFGSAALARVGMPYILVVDPEEDPSRVAAKPVSVVTIPYSSDPLSILSLTVPLHEKITGTFSFTELGMLPAALLAEALGAATVPVADVLKTRNKFYMRRLLLRQVDQPRFGLLEGTNLQNLRYPIIVKPIDGSGSEGVSFVDDPVLLRKSVSKDSSWLWEEYVDGPEFSVETVTFHGQHTLLGITEKTTTGPPHFVEIGHFTPANLSAEDTQNIRNAVFQCLHTLGIQKGAAHTEVKYRKPLTFIIETHTRPGGDRIPFITELVSGYDQYELAVRSILSMEMPESKGQRVQAAGVTFFTFRQGLITQIDGVEESRALPGLIELDLKITEGSHVAPLNSSDDRCGFAVVSGKNTEEVKQRLMAVQEHITVNYQEEQYNGQD